MSKTCLFVLIALFAVTTVLARSTVSDQTKAVSRPANPSSLSKRTCGKHGDDCVSSSECCNGTSCHIYAHKCQAIITAEDLINQRKKLRHVEINAHKKNNNY